MSDERISPQMDEPEDDEPVSLFEEKEPIGIYADSQVQRWTRMAHKGPFVLGTLAIGLALAASTYMFIALGSLPTAEELAVSVDVSADTAVPTEDDQGFVSVRFGGEQQVWVNGKLQGSWLDKVRLALPVGKHRIEIRPPGAELERIVVVKRNVEVVVAFD